MIIGSGDEGGLGDAIGTDNEGAVGGISARIGDGAAGSKSSATCIRASFPAVTTMPCSDPRPNVSLAASSVYCPGASPAKRYAPFRAVMVRHSVPEVSLRRMTIARSRGFERKSVSFPLIEPGAEVCAKTAHPAPPQQDQCCYRSGPSPLDDCCHRDTRSWQTLGTAIRSSTGPLLRWRPTAFAIVSG